MRPIRVGLIVVALAGLAGCGEDEPLQAVTLVGTEMAFAPADVSIASGTVVLRLRNEGRGFHEVAVEQQGRALGRTSAPPGRSAVLELDLEPGRYELACREPGHYESGMRGTLRVER
jgi:uncharacterized cupredoxin-like copper-binding protein